MKKFLSKALWGLYISAALTVETASPEGVLESVV